MTLEQFRALLESARREHPGWFFLPADDPATNDELDQAEAKLGVELPKELRAFLLEFGGGDFAFTNIFSVSAGSAWNLVEHNQRWNLLESEFLGVSDDGTGGVYGFVKEAEGWARGVAYLDITTRERTPTSYGDIFEFAARVALGRGSLG